MPHGLNSQVIMCIADGERLMKSKTRFASWRLVTGSGLKAWTTSGNFIASRMKKIWRLLPTRSQLPSSVYILTAKPRGSRSVSGEWPPWITVEKRTNSGVRLPFSWNSLARVYLRDRLVADRAVRLEIAVRAGAARMHDALGDALAVEVGDLLQEMVILQRRRAAIADGPVVLVVVDWMSLPGRESWSVPWPLAIAEAIGTVGPTARLTVGSRLAHGYSLTAELILDATDLRAIDAETVVAARAGRPAHTPQRRIIPT